MCRSTSEASAWRICTVPCVVIYMQLAGARLSMMMIMQLPQLHRDPLWRWHSGTRTVRDQEAAAPMNRGALQRQAQLDYHPKVARRLLYRHSPAPSLHHLPWCIILLLSQVTSSRHHNQSDAHPSLRTCYPAARWCKISNLVQAHWLKVWPGKYALCQLG